MKGFKVLSVNISEKKGTVKQRVSQITINQKGVLNDAHFGMHNRGISLLGIESFRKFEAEAKRKLTFGEFAENITTEGIELYKVNPLDRFVSNHVILEVTQIGKSCHGSQCAIFKEVGNCVMPKEGIFARAIKYGKVEVGDFFDYIPKLYKIAVLTLSDRASNGEYEDLSGPKVLSILENFYGNQNKKTEIISEIIPDNKEKLNNYINYIKTSAFDILITTGGTGIGPKDITVDVIKQHITKEIPGIMDMIRLKYGSEKPQALISRSVAGLINNTITFTLPGSVRAVEEYMSEITKSLNHLIYMVNGLDIH